MLQLTVFLYTALWSLVLKLEHYLPPPDTHLYRGSRVPEGEMTENGGVAVRPTAE